MSFPVTDRATAEAAASLIASHGDVAALEAAERAEQSRDRGNLVNFCRWRQIERVVLALSSRRIQGTIH